MECDSQDSTRERWESDGAVGLDRCASSSAIQAYVHGVGVTEAVVGRLGYDKVVNGSGLSKVPLYPGSVGLAKGGNPPG